MDGAYGKVGGGAFRAAIKRQAEIVGSVSVILGGLSGLILVFGGSVPPWETPAQAETQQAAAAKIQAQTVGVLDKLNDKVDRVERRLDQSDCNGLFVSLANAQLRLSIAPADAMARALRDATLAQMRTIPSCTPP